MALQEYDISGIELQDDEYTVIQGIFHTNKYKAVDAAGETVLRGKQELFRLKEKFPFVDDSGTEVFTVTASSVIDIAGDYVLTDADGEEVVVLDNDFSLLQDTWTIRDPETSEALAEITSRGAVFTLARNLLPFGQLIPHTYEITDSQDMHVGSIDGQFTLFKDTYEVTIDDASTVPKEPVVAAAMVIDAIKRN